MPARERLTDCSCGQPIDSARSATSTHCPRCGRSVVPAADLHRARTPLGRSLVCLPLARQAA
jgi:predicted RNA-binding Zn-ribbon protein involved in translation (DUF1610 family)